jgi:uncharacterized protein YfaS (alpha-2-macroglobulin family)
MRRLLAGLGLVLLCTCKRPALTAPEGLDDGASAAESTMKLVFDANPVEPVVRIELSEATPPGGRVERSAATPAVALSEAETAGLLARLPKLEEATGDRVDFAKRPDSLPPPLKGETVAETFPPPGELSAPEAVVAGPLQVLRASPEGDVPIAASLSVTFNQPMVAVTSVAEAAATRPVVLEPTPPGQWRWIGTRTLLFEPDGRFPMATKYTMRVLAGTKSASGGALPQPFERVFTTPAPQVTGWSPVGGPTVRDPLILVSFDQKIDREQMSGHIKLRFGQTAFPFRLADAPEIEADADMRLRVQGLQPDRFLVLRPTAPLPFATSMTVMVEAGAPSAEGPLRTPKAQSSSFRTYGELNLVDSRCGWNKDCRPGTGWQLQFSNPLDGEAFDPALVEISPPLPGASIFVSGAWLQVQGATKPQTTYTVKVKPGLKDSFGQVSERAWSATFKVGKAEALRPQLSGPPRNTVLLDPIGDPALTVYSVNHEALRMKVFRVTPGDWGAFGAWMRTWDAEDRGMKLPGALLIDQKVPVQAVADTQVETNLDLRPFLTEGHGQLVVMVEPTKPPKDKWDRQRVLVWVQVTDIGLTAMSDADELLAWATDLATGKPLSDVELSILPGGTGAAGARTAADGLARLPLPSASPGGETPTLLVARRGGDVAILSEQDQNHGWYSTSWVKRDHSDRLLWYVFDDRHMARPGEEVFVKGWLRAWQNREGGDLAALPPERRTVRWTLRDAVGNDVLSGSTPVDESGGFDLKAKIPSEMNLGDATFLLVAEGFGGLTNTASNYGFQVQEFRRPEFEVSASVETVGPHVLGQSALATVSANYYAGGALPGAETHWTVTATAGSFSPPGWGEYSFGEWTPWWLQRSWWGDEGGGEVTPEGGPWTLKGSTDATGKHHLDMHFAALKPARPMTVQATATVQDVNRQAWTGSTSLLLHPASVYVGVKLDRPFYNEGQDVTFTLVTPNIDGGAVAGRAVALAFVRKAWKVQPNGQWKEEEVERQTLELTSGTEPVRATFKPKAGGAFTLEATVVDAQGRSNQTRTTVWVSGGEAKPSRTVEQQQVVLIPNQESFQAGEVAELLVQSPFTPAEGVVTWRRTGLVQAQRFTMTSSTTVLKVPIEEGMVPNLNVQVDLVGAAPRAGAAAEDLTAKPLRPAYATGTVNLRVPPLQRTLGVAVRPREAAVEPGGSTTLDVSVKDASGRPVAGSLVAVVVVDESVLALSGYSLPDPIGAFYFDRGAEVYDSHSRAMLWLVDPSALADQAPGGLGLSGEGFGGGGAADGDMLRDGGEREVRPMAAPPPAPAAAPTSGAASVTRAAPKMKAQMEMAESAPDEPAQPTGPAIAVRTNWNPTALWLPATPTDAAGKAVVQLKLPDSLTRYRITAVAVSGGQRFGKGESSVTARKALMLRPSAPRFLNFGDRFELPFVVQNQTDQPIEVDLAVRAVNATFSGAASAGQRFTVPANDRAELRFPTETVSSGKARFQAAVSPRSHVDWSDAAEISLPVWTPATSEAFATYGELDGKEASVTLRQPVTLPGEVWTQFGGLEVSTSSTQLQALTDAVIYLTDYPYGCAEQLSSRVLGVAALKDVLGAFEAPGLPDAAALQRATAADIEELAFRQNSDGGWAFWRKGQESWPYVSVHVAHALVRAEAKGFAVPRATRDRALGYLRAIERRIPREYGPEARRTLTAYALYVRQLAGDGDVKRAVSLTEEWGGVDKMSLEAIGWLLPTWKAGGQGTLLAQAMRQLNNKVTETASDAHFVTSYGDDAYLLLHSDRRVDAILVDSLIQVDPKNDLIPKVVRALLGHRVKGRWSSTQDNIWVLLAMDRYFHTYEGVTPDFVARVWLGDRFAGEHRFKGRTTETSEIDVPMAWLSDTAGAEGKTRDLIVARQGAGRLYYRVGMRYAPKDLTLAAFDAGFAVERRYEAIDDPSDVRREADGTWTLRAGSRVRVRVTMVAPARRTHVALVDPLPAGLEVLNPELKVVGDLPPDQQKTGPMPPPWGGRGGWWRWWGPWYDHENMRDDRVEVFASLLWDGVHEYSYVARATTPGAFVVPPAKAEEMYHPETFGRSATDRVVIK